MDQNFKSLNRSPSPKRSQCPKPMKSEKNVVFVPLNKKIDQIIRSVMIDDIATIYERKKKSLK